MSDIMIAVRTGTLTLGGHRYQLRRGRTTAHATHPIVAAYPRAWTPMPVDYPAPKQPERPQEPENAEQTEQPQEPQEPEPVVPAPGPAEQPAADQLATGGVLVGGARLESDSEHRLPKPEQPVQPEPERPEPVVPEPDPAAVRAWAAEQGIKLRAGRKVPAAVIDQYVAARDA